MTGNQQSFEAATSKVFTSRPNVEHNWLVHCSGSIGLNASTYIYSVRVQWGGPSKLEDCVKEIKSGCRWCDMLTTVPTIIVFLYFSSR